MKILVTGCCGFIGSNFVKLVLSEHPDWHVTNLDLLTYAGNRESLRAEESLPNYAFVHGDICDGKMVYQLVARPMRSSTSRPRATTTTRSTTRRRS